MSSTSDHNPFVGPRPIQRGEPFYGRDTEIAELFHLLKARRIAVLHSPSGAGKSSMVQAGLMPRLRKARFDVWDPIRVNLDPRRLVGVPAGTNRYVLSAMVSLENELPEGNQRSPAELATLDLATYVRNRPRRRGRKGRSVVLLFDQFEEILTADPFAVAEKHDFFRALRELLDTEHHAEHEDVWALFIIREDYLPALAPYRHRVPTALSNTFRLDLLGLDAAETAAVAYAAGGEREFPAAHALIEDLATTQVQRPDGTYSPTLGNHIEPVQMQVVCRRLWQRMPADDRSIDPEDLQAYADVSSALGAYYADAITDASTPDGASAPDPAIERSIREWVGGQLIVAGIRSQVRREAENSGGLDNHLIDRLRSAYLVRAEQRAGALWFELAHDRLVEPVQRNNELWEHQNLHPLQVQAKLWDSQGRAASMLISEDRLEEAQGWAKLNQRRVTHTETEYLSRSEAEVEALVTQRARDERSAKKQRLLMIALMFGFVCATGLSVYSYSLYWTAEAATVKAREASDNALKKADEAKHAREEAERLQGVAEEATANALAAAKAAVEAQEAVQDALSDADEQREAAVQALAKAEAAQRAVTAEQDKVSARSLARAAEAATLTSDRVLLASLAWDQSPTDEARLALLRALYDNLFERADANKLPGCGAALAAASGPLTVCLHGYGTGFAVHGPALQKYIVTAGTVTSAALVDASTVVGAFDGKVVAWDISTGLPLTKDLAEVGVPWRSVAARGGRIALSASSPERVQLWDLARAEPLGPMLTLWGASSVPSLDRALRRVASMADGAVMISELDSSRQRRIADGFDQLSSAWINARGDEVAVAEPVYAGTGSDGSISYHTRIALLSTANGRELTARIRIPAAEVVPRAWHDAGVLLVSVPGRMPRLEVWDVTSRRLLSSWPSAEGLFVDAPDATQVRLVTSEAIVPQAPLTAAAARRQACDAAGRNLTLESWEAAMGSEAPYRCVCPDESPPPRMLACP